MRAQHTLCVRLAMGLLAAGCAAFVLAAAGSALAQYGGGGGGGGGGGARSSPDEGEEQAPTPKKKKRSRWSRSSDKESEGWAEEQYPVDKRTSMKLGLALEMFSAERLDEAEAMLGTIRESSMNVLEQSKVLRLRAFIAYARGNVPLARDYFEKTIALGVLSPKEAADMRFQIAQLWLGEENWAKAAENLELWFTMEPNPNSASYYLLALTYYQQEDIERALPRAQQAIDTSDDPKESWLQLLLALRITNEDYLASIPIIEALVRRYPKKAYWLNLSTIHGALENYEEALVPLQLAYTQGMLTKPEELQRLAQLMLALDLPFRAAGVLQKGFDEGVIEDDLKAWEMLSNSYIGAREFEKASEPLGRAASLADGGDLYIRLAQVHIQREKWNEARAALRKGLNKGLDNPGEAQLLMGIALHSQKQPESARNWFARASRQKETREEANAWLQYIERELQSS